MMNEQQYIKTYCVGCGLCRSAHEAEFETDSKGFSWPMLKEGQDSSFYEKVCPVFYYSKIDQNNVWGNIEVAIVGYSSDAETRFRAASGGALTEICCYLLKEGIVDGIIHTTYDLENPIKNICCISETQTEVKEKSGSRYSISAPLENILQMIDFDKKYAFVGKPCDVMALRSYMESQRDLSGTIVYLLSFFCAGEPSLDAQNSLLKSLGCSIDEVASITYRGNGWPGYTTIVKKNGDVLKLEYKKAWGKYLGRDLRNICRFCLDGTGDVADIVCADFWYLDENGNPDFSEHDGRNIIISRSDKGEKLLEDILESGTLVLEENFLDKMDTFYKYQPAQHKRKGTMKSLISAMKICGIEPPQYDKAFLSKCSREISLKDKINFFFGMIYRIIKGRINRGVKPDNK